MKGEQPSCTFKAPTVGGWPRNHCASNIEEPCCTRITVPYFTTIVQMGAGATSQQIYSASPRLETFYAHPETQFKIQGRQKLGRYLCGDSSSPSVVSLAVRPSYSLAKPAWTGSQVRPLAIQLGGQLGRRSAGYSLSRLWGVKLGRLPTVRDRTLVGVTVS